MKNKTVMLDIKKVGLIRYLLPFADEELRKIFSLMGRHVGLENCRVELSIVDDATMAAINSDSMGCEGPTNILSFPLVYDIFSPYVMCGEGRPVETNQPGMNRPLSFRCPDNCVLGALVVAPETFWRESFLYGQPLEEYTVFLLAHGFAHLLGHDHGPVMDALVEDICTSVLTAVTCTAMVSGNDLADVNRFS